MKFTPAGLQGAMVVDLDFYRDARGGFARSFCARIFEENGLSPTIAQCNVSINHGKGTLRGMHFQVEPATESKLVRCVRGSIQDVIIDLRADSPTYMRHFSVILSQDNRRALYVPGMFAHGYLTLTDDTEIHYNIGEFYTPGLERGVRYDDPAFGIEWLTSIRCISEKDLGWPDYGS
jgi:dTDP-4-dehydrorhamnose 3,5-epimerase